MAYAGSIPATRIKHNSKGKTMKYPYAVTNPDNKIVSKAIDYPSAKNVAARFSFLHSVPHLVRPCSEVGKPQRIGEIYHA